MALKIPDEFMPPSEVSVIRNGRSYPQEPSIGASPASPPPSLRDFFEILRRRKVIAFNAFLLVAILGVVATLMTKPVFSTGLRLLVEGRSKTVSISNSNDPLSSVFQPPPGREVDTQIEILRSSGIINQVYKEAGLKPGSVGVDVRRVDLTDVIEIVVTSGSREAADSFAVTLPKVYENLTRNERLREVSAALNFAQKTLDQQRKKLVDTEKEYEEFKNKKGVVDADAEVTAAIASSGQANTDYVAAQSKITSLEGELAAQLKQRSAMSATIDTPITTTNPAIAPLKERLADRKSERTSVLVFYKPEDERVKQIDVQIAELTQRLNNTPATVTNVSRAPNPAISDVDGKISNTRTELESARQSIGPLKSRVASQSKYLGGFNDIQTKEAQLKRDLDSSGNASKTLAESVLQLTLRKEALDAAGSPVSTMETAPPASQIAPNVRRGIMMAILLGLVAACVAALLQDSLDDHLHNEGEARALLDTSILGYFPMLSNKSDSERPILDLQKPDKALLEGFRALRSNVQFTLVNKNNAVNVGHKLLITSTMPGEGKSYVASNLAIAMALDGRRVILVDADLHRPRTHVIFDLPKQPGLTDILVGESRLQEALKMVGIPGLRVLTAGTMPPNPAELLNSVAMDAVLHDLQGEADIIIVDSPPILSTADAQVLSAKVDGVVYVMQLGRVPKSAVQRAFELLKKANASVVGVVFNKVDQKKGNGYSSYYYSDYNDYNEDDEDADEDDSTTGGKGKGAKALKGKSKKTSAQRDPAVAVVSQEVTPQTQNGSSNGAYPYD